MSAEPESATVRNARRLWRRVLPLSTRRRARQIRRRAGSAIRPYPRYGTSEATFDIAGMSPGQLQQYADSLGGWSHEIMLPGVRTDVNSSKSHAFMDHEWETMALPELAGKSVIDVGGADGGYAYMAEQHGAERIACLDSYIWSLDRVPVSEYHYRYAARGEPPPRPHHETPWWRPDDLPGKRNFNLAHELLKSRVQAMPHDFMRCDLEEVGQWDIVLFLGILYHLDDPLGALRRLRKITKEQAIIETEAVVIPHYEEPIWRVYPHAELNYDWTNWWAPNVAGLLAGLGAAGFGDSQVLQGPPADVREPQNYRLIVRATP